MTAPARIAIPAALTLGAGLCALAALYLTFEHRERWPAWFLVAAGVLDALDGPVARRLGATSRFGNVLDSLSDLLAFGVAPAGTLVLLGLCHPVAAAIYVLAIELRLARYSAAPESGGRWFDGVASPDCAYLALALGMVPGSNFSVGLLVMAAAAVYPRPLWPKGLRPLKIAVAVATVWLFTR
jgi:phosphatidylserine synthase